MTATFLGGRYSRRQGSVASDCAVYGPDTIGELDAKTVRNLTAAQLAYLTAMIRNGVAHYISNAPRDVEYGLVRHGECALPFTVSHRQQTVFPVSPKTCWIDYARLLYRNSDGRVRAPVANAALGVIGKAARFERLVTLNNWWLTNNPTPVFGKRDIRVFIEYFRDAYPGYIIVLKSAPESDPTGVIDILRGEGFDLVKFRYMHFRDPRARRTKNFRADQNLLAKTALRTRYAEHLTATEAARCAELYRRLYIDKHTAMNTALNARWMELACNSGFLDFFVMEDGGRIMAMIHSYDDPVGVNVGVCGYDLDEPQRTGLYRMLIASALRKGAAEAKTVNLSTSVPRFKALRGARRVVEYEAVYARHLGPGTQGLIKAFASIYNRGFDKMRCA